MDSSDEDQGLAENSDLFYHGVIVKLFPRNNMGVVRTESGREITFSYNLVIVVGASKSPNELKQGQKIGYDVGWTGNGLKVTKIKVFPQSQSDDLTDLKGQGSQSQKLPS